MQINQKGKKEKNKERKRNITAGLQCFMQLNHV
jgi:hypothetical protein